jgi:anthranilate phosphoribosyltransferase
VAKHGTRSASGRCGSADVLEALGVRLDLSPEQVARCVREVGVGFMFAPAHHGAMKHAIGPRREMGVRTVFNLLGPMTNPADAPNQVIGVFSDQWLEPMARVLARLGSRHVLLVHGEDGMDEISITAATRVAELKDGAVTTYTVTPEQFGLSRGTLDDLVAADVPDSAAMLLRVLDNTAGAPRDIVALNAGAAIHTAGLAPTVDDGVRLAQAAIADGRARRCLEEFKALTARLAPAK